jgi:type IV pilus assembly protein PilV
MRTHRGFALVEALVSILIFAFGVLGLIGLEARGIQFSVDAENRNRAAVFASEIASSLWVAGSVALTTAQQSAWNTAGNMANGAPVPYAAQTLPSGTVTFFYPFGATGNAVDITVTWQAPTRTTTDQLTTRVILPLS